MGNFASRIHSKEDGKVYNILPLGDMPTVVFGRVIRENSVPGMQYYFSDGRVKYIVSRDVDRQGWRYTIPFTEPKKFSVIKVQFISGSDTYLFKRYKKMDRRNIGRAWVLVINSINKDIEDSSIVWDDIKDKAIEYTITDMPEIGDYDIKENFEILDFNNTVTSSTMNPTQLPVIFTVPENLDYSRMNDVEYVRQFCRVVRNLDANTVSKNFVIRRGKIICIKEFDFGNKRIFHNLLKNNDGYPDNQKWQIADFNKNYFKYAQFKRQHDKYRLNISEEVRGCHNNEFYLIPIVKRTRYRKYKSINWYLMHRFWNESFREFMNGKSQWSFATFGPYQQRTQKP